MMLAAPGANLHGGLPERWRKRIPVRDDDPFFMDDERPRGVVAFLAAEDSDFITGANIPVNGGHYMS